MTDQNNSNPDGKNLAGKAFDSMKRRLTVPDPPKLPDELNQIVIQKPDFILKKKERNKERKVMASSSDSLWGKIQTKNKTSPRPGVNSDLTSPRPHSEQTQPMIVTFPKVEPTTTHTMRVGGSWVAGHKKTNSCSSGHLGLMRAQKIPLRYDSERLNFGLVDEDEDQKPGLYGAFTFQPTSTLEDSNSNSLELSVVSEEKSSFESNNNLTQFSLQDSSRTLR
eukprot:TRINITY_DN2708_c0_g5_i1.p1 TRINITY_DN2708_c0_g5~~TRINITY_DN2708_c0_g5_i1.p1  ORF type:complete len:222 (-),score=51.76 TRINITY_DN2708_c0_g5_i1:5-670(-)